MLLSDERQPEAKRLYKNNNTYQYKFGSVKTYYKGEDLTSGWRSSLKNAFA